jgi:hypothetical protein
MASANTLLDEWSTEASASRVMRLLASCAHCKQGMQLACIFSTCKELLASFARARQRRRKPASLLGSQRVCSSLSSRLACACFPDFGPRVACFPDLRPGAAFLTPDHAGVTGMVDTLAPVAAPVDSNATQADAPPHPPPHQPPPEDDKGKAKQERGAPDAVVCVDVFGQYLSGIGGECLLTSTSHLPHLRHLSLSSCVFPACSVAPIAQVSSPHVAAFGPSTHQHSRTLSQPRARTHTHARRIG